MQYECCTKLDLKAVVLDLNGTKMAINAAGLHENGTKTARTTVVFVSPRQLLSATRCRVDRHRITAGVVFIVALGESLRMMAAERPPSSQTTMVL